MTLFVRSANPLWWRLAVWTVMVAATVAVAHSTTGRIAGGVLMAVGAIAVQFVDASAPAVRAGAIGVSTLTALAATVASTSGLAPVLVCVAASRATDGFEQRRLHVYTALTGVAFAAAVALASQSLWGLLAGVGIPLLVQRAQEQQELVRERDRTAALLVEAEAGRDAESQAAALRERGRLARELHDVLAHSLAGLSVQLQATRAVAQREGVGQVVLEPLDKAADLARSGLAEARAVVGALRDPLGLGPADIPALVTRHPGAATFAETGPAGTLDPAAAHAVYRAVQEALTNAARHAPGATVSVTLEWTPAELRAVVRDTGQVPGRAAVAGTGTGLGLAGMTERLAEVGGRVQAGPDRAGWAVSIAVPQGDA